VAGQYIETSLIAKLQQAQGDLMTGNRAAACGKLSSFRNQVKAQMDSMLTRVQVHQMISMADQIVTALDCK
jgi:hypothetical protein